MTVVEIDRIAMAEESDSGLAPDQSALDKMFEMLDPISEGFKVEIVEGNIFMVPQRNTHWQIIRRIVRALEDQFGEDVKVTSDVRFDFPGHLNGFCPDVVKLSDAAVLDKHGRWNAEDVEFVAEVISKGTATNDYEPKKAVYAAAGIPVYLIVDPYTARCHAYTEPKDGEYHSKLTVVFGGDIDLTRTVLDLTLKTDTFPRD
ncbi:Uma2 family endonuclease [Streptomyces sp. NPDC087850]|uniref:Uma2 family endonuclease n=1 Tax=Streptomyces sp. NPDC087850 TaxID=3365809 RepID=UPI00382FA935